MSTAVTPEVATADARPSRRRRWSTGSAAPRAIPPGLRAHPYLTVTVFAVAVVLFFGPFQRSESTLHHAHQWLLYSTVVLGFYYVFAISGQFAFCQAAMMGVGAYTSALVSDDHGFLAGFVAGVAAVAAVALVFSLLVIRAGHFYFAIATLGLTQIVRVMLNQWSFFAGRGGLRLNIPAPEIFGFHFDSQYRMLWMSLGLLVAGLVLGYWIERSPLKREAIAFRDRDVVAASLGVPVVRVRVQLFVIGSCYAAAAGAVFAHWQRLLSPESFGIDLGVGIFLMLILGGTSTPWGPIIGAAFYVFVPYELRSLNEYREVAYGIVLLIVIIRWPGGLGSIRRWVSAHYQRSRRRRAAQVAT